MPRSNPLAVAVIALLLVVFVGLLTAGLTSVVIWASGQFGALPVCGFLLAGYAFLMFFSAYVIRGRVRRGSNQGL